MQLRITDAAITLLNTTLAIDATLDFTVDQFITFSDTVYLLSCLKLYSYKTNVSFFKLNFISFLSMLFMAINMKG